MATTVFLVLGSVTYQCACLLRSMVGMPSVSGGFHGNEFQCLSMSSCGNVLVSMSATLYCVFTTPSDQFYGPQMHAVHHDVMLRSVKECRTLSYYCSTSLRAALQTPSLSHQHFTASIRAQLLSFHFLASLMPSPEYSGFAESSSSMMGIWTSVH